MYSYELGLYSQVMNLRVFQKQHDAAGRHPLLASPELRAALWRLQPSGAPRQIGELLKAGRINDAMSLVQTLIVEGCDSP